MKKLYLGTNTKMYKTIRDTCEFLEQLKKLTVHIPPEAELFVIPSYTSLAKAGEILQDSRIRLGAQNMCWEAEGQFTGEVSPKMIRETGAGIIEIGHSERRHVFRETDEEENRKVKAAVREGFTALLCVGETGADKEAGISDEVLRIQLKKGLVGLSQEDSGSLWVAYEPVWAIGIGGVPASPAYAAERHRTIRETLRRLFGDEKGQEIPVLYGGSVNKENARGFLGIDNVDGLFIGRSAWDAWNFTEIIELACETAGLIKKGEPR